MLRLRFFITEDGPDREIEMSVEKVLDFLDLLRKVHIDWDGKFYTLDGVNYDAKQNALDLMCEPEEE